ncbi:MAG TPA: 30S ribosomal protein S17, partial [Anaerolineaceae bacterium]|nr:30S ribosomal protein S17 [Anaerolineaceae bacterium]
MTKTVVVEIQRTFSHPLYRKVVHSTHRVKAHDELGCQIGDRVQIVESQPISRHKTWVVEQILRRLPQLLQRHAACLIGRTRFVDSPVVAGEVVAPIGGDEVHQRIGVAHRSAEIRPARIGRDARAVRVVG